MYKRQVIDLTIEDLEDLTKRLEALKVENCKVYINVDYVESEMPDSLKEFCEEVSLEA